MTYSNSTNEPQPTSVGAFLTRERAKQRLSIYEVARRAEMQASTLSRIETGASQAPSPDVLRKLAQALDLPTLRLFQLAGYSNGDDLPTIEPYLRTKYGQALSDEARAEVAASFATIARKYGLDPMKTDPDDDQSP